MKRFTKADQVLIRNAAFKAAIEEGLKLMRATAGPEGLDGPVMWTIDTIYGPMDLQIHPTHVACLFRNPEAAEVLTQNKTGRWVHKFKAFQNKGTAACDGKYVLSLLQQVWKPA